VLLAITSPPHEKPIGANGTAWDQNAHAGTCGAAAVLHIVQAGRGPCTGYQDMM